MCFSTTTSFIAGASLSTVGVITTKKTKQKTELPFALIPLIFGIQQIIEGIIWLTFRFEAHLLNTIMTYLYSFFSHVWWPIYIPFSILLLETVPWRKRILLVFQVVGIMVGLYLFYTIIRFPVTSEVINKSIVYDAPHFYVLLVMFFYFAATCFSCLFSSHKIVNIFGILVFLFAVVAYQFFAMSFISVWCFFAAILSFIIYLYFKFR